MDAKYTKIVAGKYEIHVDGKFVGTVIKSANGKWEAYAGAVSVVSNNRNNATYSLIEKLSQTEIVEVKTEDEKYIESFDAYYSRFDIPKFAGKPLLDYFQWFKAKYGMTEWEASLHPEGLYGWYAKRYDVDMAEGGGYAENDGDEWNDYVRDWKSVNPEGVAK